MSLVFPKHSGRTRADSFQDFAEVSGYNSAALLGQVPPGRTRCLTNKAVFQQHIKAPNPTGANQQECCNRKTLLDAEGTSLLLCLLPTKTYFPFYGTHSSIFTGRTGGRGLLDQVLLQ